MTAVAAPAAAARGQRVPWTKLAWVTWRQHRAALAGAAAVLGALAVFLLIEGLRVRSAYAGVTACHPARSAACQTVAEVFDSGYHSVAQTMSGILQVVPVLIGVFAGAPLLARELETGTFRFAWTQGCGRLRWVVTKLVLLAVALTAASFAFSLLFSWYYAPFFAHRADGVLAPQLFDLRGADFAAWTLVAFAIGALAGMLIRRTVPAMAASLAAWAGLDLLTALILRKHYQPPLVSSGLDPARGLNWVVTQWFTGPGGQPVGQATIRALAERMPPSVRDAQNPQVSLAWLAHRGYTEWWAYQPAARFWRFQLIEGGWLLALSLLLGAATVWLVRRRAS